jgi:hypothetical protein
MSSLARPVYRNHICGTGTNWQLRERPDGLRCAAAQVELKTSTVRILPGDGAVIGEANLQIESFWRG